ncbi:MAG: hypothetical protein ACREP7_00265 [Lysobacter sp.]
MGALTKPATVTVIPGTPAYSPYPPVSFQLYASPSPRSAAYRQKGSFPDGPEDFHQWSQLDYSPPDGWYGPIRHMQFIRFPGVPVVSGSNGFPNPGHRGPVRGYFDVPTLEGVHREWRDYYAEGPGDMWIPRIGTFVDPPHCQTGGPCMVVMLSGFPGRGSIPSTPDTELVDRHVGWNAGANSASVLDGDVRTAFQVEIASAGVVGLVSHRADVTRFDNVEFGFYFDTDPANGLRRYALMETGRLVSAPLTYVPDDEFEVRRLAGGISYRVNGIEIYRSPQLSYGPIRVGSALYSAEDRVL